MNAFCVLVNDGERFMRSSRTLNDATLDSGRQVWSREINAGDIIARMKSVYSANSDEELGICLDVKKTTVSSWRKRNSIPLEHCIRAAIDGRDTLDWIVYGENNSTPSIHDTDIDVRLLEICFYKMDQAFHIEGLEDPVKSSAHRARWLYGEYLRADAMKHEAMRTGMSRDKFLEYYRGTIDNDRS